MAAEEVVGAVTASLDVTEAEVPVLEALVEMLGDAEVAEVAASLAEVELAATEDSEATGRSPTRLLFPTKLLPPPLAGRPSFVTVN